MARVKVDLPDQFSFSTTISVRITDINYGGHVGNDSILSLIHEARVKFLASLGYSELNVAGAGLIMADAAIEFKGEGFYGDILLAKVAVGEISKFSFELYYQLDTTRDGKNILIAKAKTGMVCFDYEAKKITPVPRAFIEKVLK
jgi:acyl-CoA thioesterase FadM